MPKRRNRDFTFEPVTPAHAKPVHELIGNDGGNGLIDCAAADVQKWCRNHSGIVALDANGEIAAACFHEQLDLARTDSASSLREPISTRYFHHSIVSDKYKRLRLGQRTSEVTVGHAFSVTDGIFANCVAVNFLDNEQALDSQARAGAIVIPETSTGIINSNPILRSLDRLARATKKRVGTRRAHALQIYDNIQLVRVAKWIAVACMEPVEDPVSRIVLRMNDPSEGRSHFGRSMRALARKEPHALARLGTPQS